MTALFIGIFAGLLSFFLIDKTILLVRQCLLDSNFAAGLRAVTGIIMAQLLWALVAAAAIGTARYEVVAGDHINSIHGLDTTFVMLGALILGFAAYRLLQRPLPTLSENETVTPGQELTSLLRIALTTPIRILIYLALFSILGIHFVAERIANLVFIVLGTGFGAFVSWSMFCSIIDKHKEKITLKQIARFSRWGAGSILLLVVFGLVFLAVF